MEPVKAIRFRDQIQCSIDSFWQFLCLPDFPMPQDRFHLGPHFLNGVQIWAVRRQIAILHASSCKRFLYFSHMMRPQIVHNDHIPRLQGGFFQIGDETLLCCSALVGDGNVAPIGADGEDGGYFTSVMALLKGLDQ